MAPCQNSPDRQYVLAIASLVLKRSVTPLGTADAVDRAPCWPQGPTSQVNL